MEYGEICVMTTTAASEAVAEILYEATGESVSITDRNDLLVGGWDYVEEGLLESYPDEAAVRGFFPPQNKERVEKETKKRLAELKKYFPDCGSLKISFSCGDDGEWLENWRKNFKPIELDGLVVCPVWLESDSKKPILKLNSGVAFGTGSHETTAMCLKLLQKVNLKGKTVVDVGCGSGILGLSALLLGAKRAVLVDFDAQAVAAARENAALSGLESSCVFLNGNLCDDVKERGVVAANLTADILARLAPSLTRVTLPAGEVVLSGILRGRLDETLRLFAANGFETKETMTEGEWSAAPLVAPEKPL